MKVFLVIFLSFHIEGGVGSQKVEFSKMQDCEAAKSQMLTDFSAIKKDVGWRHIAVSCLQGVES